MIDTIQFVDGLIVKPPHANAPDYVKAAISIKRQELAAWLASQGDDWINVQVKEAKSGKWYAAVDTWKPAGKGGGSGGEAKGAKPRRQEPAVNVPFPDDDIPFVTNRSVW